MVDLTYHEPIKGPGAERRDELGNFASYRKQPHRGSDWGFTGGSKGKPIYAIRSGVVAKVFNDPALGFSAIVRSFNDEVFIEYNHMESASPLKRGDKVEGGVTVIGHIGATGSALSASGANHLHASAAKAPVPHNASRAILLDLFKLIDKDKPAVKPVAKKPAAKKVAK